MTDSVTAVTTTETKAVTVMPSPDDIEKEAIAYLDVMGATKNLLPSEKTTFIKIARAFCLSPFKREIYINAYGQGDNRKCSIITGFEVYIKRAERSGKLDGWKVYTEGNGNDAKAIVEIYRKDMKYPFVHEVYYTECVQYNREGKPNAIWAKQPRYMTKKVAISQAFRLCFPDELGGMPYEESEMPQEERNVTDGDTKIVGENLAKEAERNITPEAPTPQLVIDSIGKVLHTKTPDQLLYFSDKEIKMEAALVEGAADISVLINQLDRLEKELAKRQASYKPAPFGDTTTGTPSMYQEPEDNFVDDDPYEKSEKAVVNGELDIV